MAEILVVRHAQASFMRDDYDQLCPRGERQAARLATHLAARVPAHLASTRVSDNKVSARDGAGPWRIVTGPARRHKETAAPIHAALTAATKTTGAPSPCVATSANARLVGPIEAPGWNEFDLRDLLGAASRSGDPALLEGLATMAAAEGFSARSRALHHLTEATMARWIAGTLTGDRLESWAEFEARVGAALDAAVPESGCTTLVVTSVGPISIVLGRVLGLDPMTAFRTASRVRNSAVTTLVSGPPGLTLDRFNDTAHLPDPDDLTLR